MNGHQKFEFTTATRIIFGAGRLQEVGGIAKEFGQRALVVTGRDAGRAEPLVKLLRENGISSITYSVSGEPDLECVERGGAQARRERCELVISIGGGSVLDAGKAIAAMTANDGELLDYLEIIGRGQSLVKPSLPFIAIPTTAGTGSEVTRNAVLAAPAHRAKVSLRSPLMLPRVALVDPELTRDLPPALTASTSLDALTQLIEPYVCTRANPMTDALCIEGIQRAATSLRLAYADAHKNIVHLRTAASQLNPIPSPHDEGMGRGLGRGEIINIHGASQATPLPSPLPARSSQGEGEDGGSVASERSAHDAAAREDMALASLFGGMALANAGLGAVHGLAGPIGGMFPAPHGAVCAALLPHVMRTNLLALQQRAPESKALARYEHVARLLTGEPGAKATDGINWVVRLIADFQIPRLRTYGIGPEHINELIARAAKASSMKANPVLLTTEELEGIMEKAL